ncbi:hypothetical protein [Merismopedia glauca]|uniref:Uncharacterized protein n=2 Tax=Merismopedia TaxID=53402 RepID=A0A2T1C3T8_9CYAN|nr:hypothetical protein [Merismopedia glauca]PSB02783.1 hypothetical protein C7B64_11565 [Merismopedia glauca CCAP 1448/3]
MAILWLFLPIMAAKVELNAVRQKPSLDSLERGITRAIALTRFEPAAVDRLERFRELIKNGIPQEIAA